MGVLSASLRRGNGGQRGRPRSTRSSLIYPSHRLDFLLSRRREEKNNDPRQLPKHPVHLFNLRVDGVKLWNFQIRVIPNQFSTKGRLSAFIGSFQPKLFFIRLVKPRDHKIYGNKTTIGSLK